MTNGCPAGGLDSPRRCRDCDISGHGDIGRLHYRDNDIPSYGYCDRLCRWSVEVAIGEALSANGSTEGTDIIAAIINKDRNITLGERCLSAI